MRRTIFFDFETGGVEDHHPNIQLAAVAVEGWQEVGAFERKIQFDPGKCDPEALEINGWAPKRWECAVSERDCAQDFDDFLCEHAVTDFESRKTGRTYKAVDLAGFNITRFDVPRLRKMMEPWGYWPGCWWYPLDVAYLVHWHFARSGENPNDRTLQGMAKRFGIEGGQAHDALGDVRTTIALAKHLLEARHA